MGHNQTKSNYSSLATRIRRARTAEQINKANKVADKIYYFGLLSSSELARIDSLAMDRLISLERNQ